MLAALFMALAIAHAPHPSHALAVAQATTVSIHAVVTKTDLIDDDGNPTTHGKSVSKSEDVCSGFIAYERKFEGTRDNPAPFYLDLVVTARHCMMTETETLLGTDMSTLSLTPDYVTLKSGEPDVILGSVQAPGDDDIAFLATLSHGPHSYAYLAPSLPDQGDALLVYGMPLGQHFAMSPALMMQDHALYHDANPDPEPWENNSYLIACPACGPGDSGGPVFNARGQVVGIINAQGDNAQTLMYPLERIKYYLSLIGMPTH